MGFDKMVALLGGKPVLQWSLDAFLQAKEVETVVVVTSEERFAQLDPGSGKPVLRVDGDCERFLSVMRGLDALSSPPDYVAVHDGARPLILPEQIDEVIRASRRVTETLKKADDHGFTQCSVSRDQLWIMETPQSFRFKILQQAYQKTTSQHLDVTDDVSAAEAIGIHTKLIENPLPNLKITVAQDLTLAEAILRTRQA